MPDDLMTLPAHAATRFPGLRLDAHGFELPDEDGAPITFEALLASTRGRGRPPIARAALEAALDTGAPEVAGAVNSAIEEHAAALAELVRRVLRHPDWHDTQRVLIGGALRAARIGEIAIGRAAALLRAEGGVRLAPLRHEAQTAGLIGAAWLVWPSMLEAADAVLAAELDDAAFRAAVVLPRLGVSAQLAAAGVWRQREWHHRAERADRAAVVGQLAGMIADLAGEANAAGLSLAPVVALGLPGAVDQEGRLLWGHGALPGDWDDPEVRLAPMLARLLPLDGGGHPDVILHDGAVVQGLSEAPFVRDVARWGVLTVGAAIGNARFTNLPIRG